jgi:hypothetical protein
MDLVVTPTGGVHPEDDPAIESVLRGPLQELERPVRAITPAERLVVLAEGLVPSISRW